MSTSDETGSTVSTILRELGKSPQFTTVTKYLIHTSSIPLASTYHASDFYENTLKSFHGKCENCMFGRTGHGILRKACLCRDYVNHNVINLCFLDFIKRAVGPSTMEGMIREIDPADCSFCFDTIAFGDRKYPSDFAKAVGVPGWRSNMDARKNKILLEQLYWYKTSRRKSILDNKIDKMFSKFKERASGKILNHIRELDNFVIKVTLALPGYLGDYRHFLKVTSESFEGLLDEDLNNSRSLYDQMKRFGNHIKSHFNSDSGESRFKVFEQRIKGPMLCILEDAVEHYRQYVLNCLQEFGVDKTNTLEWRKVMTILLQNRSLGLPPDRYYVEEVNAYLNKMTSDPGPSQKDALMVIQNALKRAKIPRKILEEDEEFKTPLRQRMKEMISESLRIDTKITASFEHTRKEGGKLADAHRLIQDFFMLKKRVRVYDLSSGRVIDHIDPNKEVIDEVSLHPEIIFWISFQFLLNRLVRMGKIPPVYFYPLLYRAGPHYFEKDLFKMKAEFIKEQGKIRGLSKTSACLHWFLSPMMALANSVIALLPEHYDGLKRGGHGWKFAKRLSATTVEGSFLYDDKGQLKPGFFFYYTDWKEATDFIEKDFGVQLFLGLSSWVDLPRFYVDLVSMTLLLNLEMHFIPDKEFPGLQPRKMAVKKGFMMGLPMTKTILHLCQMYKQEKAYMLLEAQGRSIQRPLGKAKAFPHRFPVDKIRGFDPEYL